MYRKKKNMIKPSYEREHQRERGRTTSLVLATIVTRAFIMPHPKQHKDVQMTERENKVKK